MLERGFEFAPGYHLQEFLGRGQFGQVWRASAPGGTAAAVKFIDLTEGSGQKEYAGVKRVKQIRQANLMPITAIWLLNKEGKVIEEPTEDVTQTVDVSAQSTQNTDMAAPLTEEPAWLVVAMLLGGKSLLQRMLECRREGLAGIPPKELLSYMDESAKGLDFLNQPRHDLGEGPVAIQHCDVKPGNIVMIGTSAVVCDFGLARILSRNQITATSASGTPAYMAPEAIGGHPSRTSDQYSLAVTYYHLRTGALPIKEGTLFEVLDAHRHGRLDFGGIGPAEQEVLRKATDLQWQDRFETNADFVDALREAFRSEGFTRPKFVPQSSSVSASESPQETVRADSGQQETNRDALATIETEPPTPRPTGVPESEAARPSPSRSYQKPLILVGIIATCLLAIGIIQAFPSGQPDPVNNQTQPNDNGDHNPKPEQSPQQLLASAISQLETDEAKAIEWFNKAISADRSIADLTPKLLSGHSGAIEKLLQSADGTHLVSIGYDNAPFIWRVDSIGDEEKPQKLSRGSDPIYPAAMELSPDGNQILNGSGRVPSIWTVQSQDSANTQVQLPEHDEEILAVAWHPTAPRFVATASADGKVDISELGSATTEQPHGSFVRSKFFDSLVVPTQIAFDPGGDYLVLLGEQGSVRAFAWKDLLERMDGNSAPSSSRVSAEGARVACIDFVHSTDGQSLVAAGSLEGSITLWSLEKESLQQDRFAAHDGSPVEAICAARSGDRCVVASAGGGGKIAAWPVAAPAKQKTLPISGIAVAAIDISGDGRWIAAGGNDGRVWLWDHEQDKAASFNSGADTVDSVRIDSAGRWLIAGCSDGTIRMWDLATCKLIALTMRTIKLNRQPKQPADMTQA